MLQAKTAAGNSSCRVRVVRAAVVVTVRAPVGHYPVQRIVSDVGRRWQVMSYPRRGYVARGVAGAYCSLSAGF